MNPELQKYVSEARTKGMSDEVIRQELQKAGWNEADINQAVPTKAPLIPRPQQNISSASAMPAATVISQGRRFPLWTTIVISMVVIAVVLSGALYLLLGTEGIKSLFSGEIAPTSYDYKENVLFVEENSSPTNDTSVMPSPETTVEIPTKNEQTEIKTSSPASENLKTFKNQYISFQYPSSWNITDESGPETTEVRVFAPNTTSVFVGFMFFKNKNAAPPLDQIIEFIKNDYTNNGYTYKELPDTIIAGISTPTFLFTNKNSGKQILSHVTTYSLIDFGGYESNHGDTAQKIINSLKILY